MAEKWDFEKHRSEPYNPPSYATIYEDDMEKIVVCADCGKPMKFGTSYVSLAIHNFMGFGYAVCADCHEKELAAKIQSQQKGQ